MLFRGTPRTVVSLCIHGTIFTLLLLSPRRNGLAKYLRSLDTLVSVGK